MVQKRQSCCTQKLTHIMRAIWLLPLFFVYLMLQLLLMMFNRWGSLLRADNLPAFSLQQAGRILVIGSPGSGKTFFCKKLAHLTKLPLVSMDDLYWKSGWIRSTNEELQRQLLDVLQTDKWIIDGNYYDRFFTERLERCDTVIVLDVGMIEALTGVLARSLNRYLFFRELPERLQHNPIRKFDLSANFIRLVLTFRKKVLPKMMKQLDSCKGNRTIFVFKSKVQASKWLLSSNRNPI